MKVILLAAGRSQRMKPIEDKNFLKFLGKPLVQHQLEQLISVGLRDFVIVGGEHNLARLEELAQMLLDEGSVDSIEVVEQKDLNDGMAGAMMSIEPVVKSGPMFVVSANDVVESKAFEMLMEAKGDGDADGILIAKAMDEYFPGGYLNVKDGFIESIVEKPGAGNEPSNMVNIVLHYFAEAKDLFDALHQVESEKDDRYEVGLDSLFKAGKKFKALPYDGFWQAVKFPWHDLPLKEYFLKQIPKIFPARRIGGWEADIALTAVIKGDVILEEGVKVFDHATIIGPAYIGKNSIVATNAVVRGSMIGDNCVVGYATEVARSYWGDSVWTHSNYIGDSILGNNVSFGAGTVTGNLRFDEGNIPVNIKGEKMDSGRNKFGLITGNHVRSGVNTSFMPGVKIGTNVCIGAGIVIGEDIEDNKFVTGKFELKQYDNKVDVAAINREELKKKLS